MAHHRNVAFRVLESGPDGAFEGYASIFDKVDHGRDAILRGAFARTLTERGASGIKLLWQHDPREPVGVIDRLVEDERGLLVSGRLLLDVARAREAYALMRAGALDGLSIGFKVRKAQVDAGSGVRRLLDLDLWEISLVTFPMQPAARLTAVKAQPATMRDFEHFLRDAGGFSRRTAKAIAAHGYAKAQRDAAAAATDWSSALASIRHTTSILQSGDCP